jgi:hypothetical protein
MTEVRIEAMLAEGKKPSSISKELGVSSTAVARIKRLRAEKPTIGMKGLFSASLTEAKKTTENPDLKRLKEDALAESARLNGPAQSVILVPPPAQDSVVFVAPIIPEKKKEVAFTAPDETFEYEESTMDEIQKQDAAIWAEEIAKQGQVLDIHPAPIVYPNPPSVSDRWISQTTQLLSEEPPKKVEPPKEKEPEPYIEHEPGIFERIMPNPSDPPEVNAQKMKIRAFCLRFEAQLTKMTGNTVAQRQAYITKINAMGLEQLKMEVKTIDSCVCQNNTHRLLKKGIEKASALIENSGPRMGLNLIGLTKAIQEDNEIDFNLRRLECLYADKFLVLDRPEIALAMGFWDLASKIDKKNKAEAALRRGIPIDDPNLSLRNKL